MAELLLVNPRRRKRKPAKRRSKARSYHIRRSARRHNPVRRLKRRKSVRKYVARRAHRRPIRHHRKRRSYRRNPLSMPSFGGIGGTVIDSGKGALGALANDALMTYIPLPLSLKTGMLGQLARTAMAFVLGWGTSMVGGRSLGAAFTRGALTVQIYALAKPMVTQFVPLADGDMGYYNPGTVLSDNGMGAYLSGGAQMAPWMQYDVTGDDGDAFAGMGDSVGFYAQ
jgi:hypothetical protein